MGYRTLVMFNNDLVDQIESTPDFARKLHSLILQGTKPHDQHGLSSTCWVVQQDHADYQRLALVNNFQVKSLAVKGWQPMEGDDDITFKLLREAAGKLGYRLVKKRANER